MSSPEANYEQIQRVAPTVIRKRPKPKLPALKEDTTTVNMKVINLYSLGKSVDEISAETGWLPKSIQSAINKHFQNLKVLLETEALISGQGKTGYTNTKKQIAAFKNQKEDR